MPAGAGSTAATVGSASRFAGDPTTTAKGSDAGASGYLAQLREGFGFLRRHPLLRSIAGMVFFTNLADAAMSGLLLLLWADQHGANTGRLGLVIAVFGVGAVTGTAVMAGYAPRLPRRWTFAAAFLLTGAPRFLILVLPVPFGAVLAVWALSGLGAGAINPLLSAAEYDAIPRPLQARVLSTVGALAWAGIPFGALLAGALVNLTNLRTTLLIGAAFYLAATLDPFLRPSWALMNRSAAAPAGTAPVTAPEVRAGGG